MASSKKPITYHVVPRFDIAAKGGPLALGTVVSDINTLVPLNRGKSRVEVPDDLIYTPVHQTNFKGTLAKARNANITAWAVAMGLPVGAFADIGSSNELDNNVSCESILTRYFDPDPSGDYVRRCLGVKSIRDWLNLTKRHNVDLYIITGLKVARKLKFNQSAATEVHTNVEGRIQEPNTNLIEAGTGVNIGSRNAQNFEFEVDDIIIGVRFNRYSCNKPFWGGERKTRDQGLLHGDMQGDRQEVTQHLDIEFKQLPIPEEIAEEEKATAQNETECWISRKD